jgi:Uma2 family endonuclease
MVMPAIARRWTREEVLRLIEQHPDPTPRYELVDGVLLVSPSPSLAHQRAVSWMHGMLFEYLRAQADVGEVLTSPADTEPEPGVTVQPDVFVLPREEVRRIVKWPARVLLLAVEVLSPGDRSGDRTRKRAMYQRSIPEYWIVDTNARAVEVWRPESVKPEIRRDRLEWHPSVATAPLVIDVIEYFARVHGETL